MFILSSLLIFLIVLTILLMVGIGVMALAFSQLHI